jgi:hypothetical protein
MNAILFNIAASASLMVLMAFVFTSSAKYGGYDVFFNFILFAGSAFITGYLIVDYQHIISSPLNERLNFYETSLKALSVIRFLIWYYRGEKKKS